MAFTINGRVTGYVAGTSTVDVFMDLEVTSLGPADIGVTDDGTGAFPFSLYTPDADGSEQFWLTIRCRNASGELVDAKVIGPYVVADWGFPS